MIKRKKRINITAPSITDKEIQLVAQAAKEAWHDKAYLYVREFEKKMAEYLGVKHAIATSSCTGAMHLALLSLKIKEGDEVILPDITWASTAFAVCYVKATPVFIDIEKDTWCIDINKIQEKISKRTKAIIPVDLYGHPANMSEINRIAREYNLKILEDAAESLGSLYQGRHTGSFGNFAALSFHGTKILTTGEGGMLLTNDEKLYQKASFLNNMAKSPDKLFWNLDIGYKYKMSDLQAALGLAQLKRIDELITKKRQIFTWYKKRLSNIDGFRLNSEREDCFNIYWMVTLIYEKKFHKRKEEVMKKLDEMNIDPRPFFYPLSSMPPFKQRVNNIIAYDLSKRGINLPCGHNISEDEVDYVCQVVKKIFNL